MGLFLAIGSEPGWGLRNLTVGSQSDGAAACCPPHHRGRGSAHFAGIAALTYCERSLTVDVEHEVRTQVLGPPHADDVGEKRVENDVREITEPCTVVEVDRVDPHLTGTHPRSFSRRNGTSLGGAHVGIPRGCGQVAPLLVQPSDRVVEEISKRSGAER